MPKEKGTGYDPNSAAKITNEAARRRGEYNKTSHVGENPSDPRFDKYDITRHPSKLEGLDSEKIMAIVENPDADKELLHEIATTNQQKDILEALSQRVDLLPKTLEHFSKSSNPKILGNIIYYPQDKIPQSCFENLLDRDYLIENDGDRESLYQLIARMSTNQKLLSRILDHKFIPGAYGNENLIHKAIENLLLRNPHTPEDIKAKIKSNTTQE